MGIRPETARAILEASDNARAALLDRLSGGRWIGRLSSSALSTAVATVALSWMKQDPDLIRGGLEWLARHQEPDGGWGDTPGSPSNPSTTLLCWAAFYGCASLAAGHGAAIERAERWLTCRIGTLDPLDLASRILDLYGKDRTFSVPILTLCALCGCLGPGGQAWRRIPQLPFELAALPHQLFQWLRLPVVSYAIPALIAVGLARHENLRGSAFHPLRALREWIKPAVLRVLRDSQPDSGGFLEAAPLTGFVVMALAASGLREHPVAQRGTRFLAGSVRADGSWPIDVNLSTWLTTLSVGALAAGSDDSEWAHVRDREGIVAWLLGQQHRREHPFTHAAPGGWAWTDLPGGVPDADDTAGVLLALNRLDPHAAAAHAAVISGVSWLLGVQNRDGGIPTFCRGWLNLPFDRSCADITAHALAAWSAWEGRMPARLRRRVQGAMQRALGYLARAQRPDGAWIPLWFGSQHTPDHSNPLYGTARVILALDRLPPSIRRRAEEPFARALTWLVQTQQPEGGWGAAPGAPATIEETALALDALAAADVPDPDALERGSAWLLRETRNGTDFRSSTIGLYFAKLWYFEELYPMIFSCSAFGRLAGAIR
ncbi:MAG: squalene--hopene cyclase [Verrucomicrobia bacterium]|nr:squalene--hopene cyclase [Verrucomicrobiota bacterium]